MFYKTNGLEVLSPCNKELKTAAGDTPLIHNGNHALLKGLCGALGSYSCCPRSVSDLWTMCVLSNRVDLSIISYAISGGGIGWTGPTTCASGTTCTFSNSYYSQCLPGGSGNPGNPGNPTTTVNGALPTGTSTASLNTIAKAAGKLYFGSATDNPEFSDASYVADLSNAQMFGQITPGNSMKWVHIRISDVYFPFLSRHIFQDAIEPEQNVFDFTGGDQVASLAKGNGQILRGTLFFT